MKSIVFLVCFSAFLFATVSTSNTEVEDDYGADGEDTDFTFKIVKGKYAAEGMFPWMVALYYDSNFICSAFIISKNTLLTAAHCVVINNVLQPASSFTGHAGSVSRDKGRVVVVRFDAVVVHPGYNTSLPSPANDIAVLKTRAPLALEPLCVKGRSTRPKKKRLATVMGWGRTARWDNGNSDRYPDILQYTEYRILSPLSCSFIGRGDRRKLCASALRSGFCSGDSGSPLIQYKKDGTPMAVGVASYGFELFICGKTVGPDIFMKIMEYIDFIQKNTETNVICKK